MVDAVITWPMGSLARQKVMALTQADRDSFMKKVRQWITDTPALVANNPGGNTTTITRVNLNGTDPQ
jgi:hypothetical protein